ncbi:hypothetical protein [Eubacterium ramulus]|uniref:hypothetical protein n=1 Tax=Eubacterium ramulus TaxID=39490 RepID=UPI00399B8804
MTLEEALRKQVELCTTLENYRCGVYVASEDHFKMVYDNLLRMNHMHYISKYYKNPYGAFIIDFTSSSQLKVIMPNESIRGCKHHGLVIDSEIDIETKNMIIYPSLVPKMFDFGKWESWDVVKSRVFEVDFPDKIMLPSEEK